MPVSAKTLVALVVVGPPNRRTMNNVNASFATVVPGEAMQSGMANVFHPSQSSISAPCTGYQ